MKWLILLLLSFPAFSQTTYTIQQKTYAPQPIAGTNILMSDDATSPPIPIGFTFCFFGIPYTNAYIGSNGWIGFTSGQPIAFTPQLIPSNNWLIPKNCIMGPWYDLNPGIAGFSPSDPAMQYIFYYTAGTTPNRRFVVRWHNIPLYLCTAIHGGHQIVIYETSNIIDTNIFNKTVCLNWVGGKATHGIHNLSGTVAYVVPGRNSTVWTAVNETWRFTPSDDCCLPIVTPLIKNN